jgi:membrane protein YqaA with SNARE-associated domain
MQEIQNKPFFTSLFRRHNYYSKTGFYKFLLLNALKVIGIILVVVFVFLILEKWVLDVDMAFETVFNSLSNGLVLLVFLISESLFGLIPPDLFILWGRKFEFPWLMVGLLSAISYLGGIISYVWGYKIGAIKKINQYLTVRFKDHFTKIKRWGALFIIVAALFPIPYSVVCVLSGMLKYPFKIFLWLGLFRILRFFVYGLVLFGILSM